VHDRTGTGVIDELLRQRAYEISLREDAGSPEENWDRAVQELMRDLPDSGDDDET
jgi:hypothetical protein